MKCELRAMYTSAVLPNGIALGTVIAAQAKRWFLRAIRNERRTADSHFGCRLVRPSNVLALLRTAPQGEQGHLPPTGRVVSKEGGLASFGSHRAEIRMAPSQARLPRSR
jgi:hypothetical protein